MGAAESRAESRAEGKAEERNERHRAEEGAGDADDDDAWFEDEEGDDAYAYFEDEEDDEFDDDNDDDEERDSDGLPRSGFNMVFSPELVRRLQGVSEPSPAQAAAAQEQAEARARERERHARAEAEARRRAELAREESLVSKEIEQALAACDEPAAPAGGAVAGSEPPACEQDQAAVLECIRNEGSVVACAEAIEALDRCVSASRSA